MESVRCIKDLKPEIEECALKCRVTRIWDAVNTKANNDFISLDLILIDEKVCTLQPKIISRYIMIVFFSLLPLKI